jgi:hypothetical protein
MLGSYRLTEACALLPLLYTSPDQPNTVLCLGTQAENWAADCLRWRDVSKVYLLSAPVKLRDKRIEVGLPPAGSCSAVLTSPDEPADAHAAALRADGIFCASTFLPAAVTVMLGRMRALFPRNVSPWREHTPAVLFGALGSPRGVPTRRRDPPGGARHLSTAYLPCLFTFAADELPLVFGGKTPTVAKPEMPRVQPA